MLKPHWYKRGIIHYFLVFLLLACLLPSFLASALLLSSVNKRLANQREHQLDTSLFLVKEEVRNAIEHLLLVSEGAALDLEEQREAASGQTLGNHQLQRSLEAVKASKKLDFIAIFDEHERFVAGSPSSVRISGMLGRKSWDGVVTDDDDDDKQGAWGDLELLPAGENTEPTLFLIAGIPIQLKEHEGRNERLILGKRASGILDDIDYIETISGASLQVHLLNAKPTERPVVNHAIVEKHDTRTLQLSNSQGQRIAEIVIHMDPSRMPLQEEELLHIFVFLLTVLLLIGVAVYWFYRYVLSPIQHIMQATSSVAANRLDTRVESPHAKGEIRQTIQQFNRMIAQLESHEKSRNAFIASITHDLRTPLHSEKRVIELFQEFRDELPGQFATLVDNLKDSNLYLLEMINTLLEVYRYEAGKVPLDYGKVDLSVLLPEVFLQLAPLAERKNIEMLWRADEGMSLSADRQQIKRLLINLIGNAIENIPKECRVQVQVEQSAEQTQIQIVDNGPGMPKDAMAGVFEGYYISANKARKIGTGLGLYICKCIVEAHHGTITLDSSAEGGTRIYVHLPNTRPTENTAG